MSRREAAVAAGRARARLEALLAELAPSHARSDSPADVDSRAVWGPPDDATVLTPAATPRRHQQAPPAAVGQPVPRRAAAASGATLFTMRHAAVVAGLGLIGLVATVWGISQARAVPVEAPVPVAVASGTVSPSQTPPPRVRVHVIGAVLTPGVVSLPDGARVEDAVAAAGGLRPDARPGELNLAQVVSDGAQIAVGDAQEPGGAVRGEAPAATGSSGTTSAKLDLNRASAEQLDGLPGVGPVTAAAILSWRSEHGRFTRIEELGEIDGIGAKTLEKLAPLVRV